MGSSHAGSPSSTSAGGLASASASSPNNLRQRRHDGPSDGGQGNVSDARRDQRPRGTSGLESNYDRTRGPGMDSAGDSGSRADKSADDLPLISREMRQLT